MITAMSAMPLYGIPAFFTLIPAVLLVFRHGGGRDSAFWGALGLAVLGSGAQAIEFYHYGFGEGFSFSLWVTITSTLVLFVVGALVLRQGWRLLFLLAPYLLLLGGVATLFHLVFGEKHVSFPVVSATDGEGIWFFLHVVVGILSYALLTFAAVAALSAFLQERALKHKSPNRLTRKLPSVAESEALSLAMLLQGGLVLGLGLCSGLAVNWLEHRVLLDFNHKSILSILTFVTVVILIVARFVSGTRGRVAARLVLLAWLFLTLAWPGVKFVSQALL